MDTAKVTVYVYTALSLVFLAVLAVLLLVPQGVSAKETIKADAVIDVTSLKFQDVNNNKKPDAGEYAVVLGKLFAPGTKTEIGTYRCTFVWGGWSQNTDGIDVSTATQQFDVRGKGVIVAVGDEPTTDSIGKAVTGVIAGGTGAFTGITGTVTLTMKPVEGTNWPGEGVLEIERPSEGLADLRGQVRTLMGVAIAGLAVAVVGIVLTAGLAFLRRPSSS